MSEREELVTCHVCGATIPKSEAFKCEDCGEWTCQKPLCGDGILCSLCIGDEVFMADILDLTGDMM